MASTLSRKWLKMFCQKAQNFKYFPPYNFVKILPACGPNTYQIMYGESLDFQVSPHRTRNRSGNLTHSGLRDVEQKDDAVTAESGISPFFIPSGVAHTEIMEQTCFALLSCYRVISIYICLKSFIASHCIPSTISKLQCGRF